MTIILKNKDTLQVEEFIFRCSIGKNGISKKKIEISDYYLIIVWIPICILRLTNMQKIT